MPGVGKVVILHPHLAISDKKNVWLVYIAI